MKIRLKGAQKGHSLLKKKADALTLRFRQILGKIIEVKISPVADPLGHTALTHLGLSQLLSISARMLL